MYCTSTDDTGTGTKGTDSACTGAYGSSSSNIHSFKFAPHPPTTLHYPLSPLQHRTTVIHHNLTTQ